MWIAFRFRHISPTLLGELTYLLGALEHIFREPEFCNPYPQSQCVSYIPSCPHCYFQAPLLFLQRHLGVLKMLL